MNNSEQQQQIVAKPSDVILNVVRGYKEPIKMTDIAHLAGVSDVEASRALHYLYKKGHVDREARTEKNAGGKLVDMFYYIAARGDVRIPRNARSTKAYSVMTAVSKAAEGLRSAAIQAIRQGKYADAKGILAALEKLDASR